MHDLIVIGGGAAGFFTAIRLAELSPGANILILEKSNKTLSKVKISGGGRCNVTHACFIPAEMTAHYPRGEKEMRGPFHTFLCGDMMAWLSGHGVETKMEDDGRVFPVSNSSQTIIDCFESLCQKHKITIRTSQGVTGIQYKDDHWLLKHADETSQARHILMATGSTPSAWELVKKLGHSVAAPVPSLFTFNIKHPLLEGIPGLSMPQASVEISQTKFAEFGPLLITHWGLSGPAILKLSAWAARELHAVDYQFEIKVDWTGLGPEAIRDSLDDQRRDHGNRLVKKYPLMDIPRRLWERMCYVALVRESNYASLNSTQLESLIETVAACRLKVKGKSTFKDEFVTCGGVSRKEIDFKRMRSKIHDTLYLAGEVIDIDAITGGFNFQAAWTEGELAAQDLAKRVDD